MYTREDILSCVSEIRCAVQADFLRGQSMMRGSKEVLEKLLVDNGWQQIETEESGLFFWQHKDGRAIIIVLAERSVGAGAAWSAHGFDTESTRKRKGHERDAAA